MNLQRLGDRIRRRRESMKLSQLQLANSLHISPQAVSKWERGINAPDLGVIPLLSRVLGTSLDDLLLDGDSPQRTFHGIVLTTSIRGFAARASSMAASDVAILLNGVFYSITQIILDHRGVPVKYLGDGFLAYFSGPGFAQRSMDAIAQLNAIDIIPGLTISAFEGPIYLGTIGHGDYAQTDIIGDTVNQCFLQNHWASDHQFSVITSLTSSIRHDGEGMVALADVCPDRTVWGIKRGE